MDLLEKLEGRTAPWSSGELATLLGVTPQTIYGYAARGWITGEQDAYDARRVLYTAESVRAYVRARATGGAS